MDGLWGEAEPSNTSEQDHVAFGKEHCLLYDISDGAVNSGSAQIGWLCEFEEWVEVPYVQRNVLVCI